MTMIVDYYKHSGHRKNYVAQLIRTGFSDSGYELFAGHEMIVADGHAYVNWWRDMWRNDDGRIMEVSFRFIRNENQDKVSVDKFIFRCVSD